MQSNKLLRLLRIGTYANGSFACCLRNLNGRLHYITDVIDSIIRVSGWCAYKQRKECFIEDEINYFNVQW